jgi:hypothetical protein
MKALFSTLLLIICMTVTAQDKTKVEVVEVSCGQCQFGMKANGCSLAVRIDGKSYFVDGTTLDEHGDAHAEDGFCNAVRQAEVIGEVKDGRFAVTYFKLLPLKK